MSLPYEKRFIFFIFLGLLTISSQLASAQDKNREQIFTDTKSETYPSAMVEISTVSEIRALARVQYPTNQLSLSLPTGRLLIESAALKKTLRFDRFDKTAIRNVGDDFRSNEQRKRYGGFDRIEKPSFRPLPPITDAPDDAKDFKVDDSFRWMSATRQTLTFLAIQHGYAFTQPKTRESIKGKFWKDYAKSVKSLHGWADGGRFFTNYIAHPMQGAFLGYVQIQNDPKDLKQQFAQSPDYWRSRLKAMAWSAAWSTQFEIGPLSQASIGNVGLKGKQTYIDLVVTPTVGTAWLITEDAVDLFITKRIERNTNNFYIRIFSRMLLSPTRTIANVFRFKPPWYRDRPTAR